jgi:methylated-DNA-[protein]-cysteine S-methyltransferase
MLYDVLDTPIGPLFLAGDTGGVRRISFGNASVMKEARRKGWEHNPAQFRDASRQFDAYFSRSLTNFVVEFSLSGSPFQLRVWKELLAIPYGTVLSYSALASRLGQPTAARAVGRANRTNPLPILIPCHRLIGVAGALTGYIGGVARPHFG